MCNCKYELAMSRLSKVIIRQNTDRQVMCGHFQSCDKDGGHTIRSNIAENPVLHANLMALSSLVRSIRSD